MTRIEQYKVIREQVELFYVKEVRIIWDSLYQNTFDLNNPTANFSKIDHMFSRFLQK